MAAPSRADYAAETERLKALSEFVRPFLPAYSETLEEYQLRATDEVPADIRGHHENALGAACRAIYQIALKTLDTHAPGDRE